jgi:transcriptional regulator with XRE-family HTH domain
MPRLRGPILAGSLAVQLRTSKPVLTGAQMRAARGFLNWSVQDLSQRCGVSESAISRAERVDGVPGMQARNLDAVRAAFEAGGIEFIEATGLRLRGK